MDDQGVKFVMNAHEAGLAEIKASTLAEQKSDNPQIQSFAKMMITDHTTAGNELDTIAANNRISVTDSLTTAHKTAISNMAKLNGAAFDKAYIELMVADHNKVIDMFHHANENTSATLHNFSDKITPKLKMHLADANNICATLK